MSNNWMSETSIAMYCDDVVERFGDKEFSEGELSPTERHAVLSSKDRFIITTHPGKPCVGGFLSSFWSAKRIV